MDKINFQNLPNQTTPLNATNLNQLQTNVDNGKVDKTVEIYDSDLNNLKTTGFYRTSTNATNKPSSLNYFVEVIAESNNSVVQYATARSSDNEYIATYQRICLGGTWSSWQVFPITTTNTNGTSIKFADGTMICTKTVDFTNTEINTADGSLYRSASLSLGNYAEEFYAAPTLQLTISRGSSVGWVGYISSVGKNAIGNIYIYRPTTTSSGTYHVEVTAVGRWKA